MEEVATLPEITTENWGEGDLAEMKKISADAKIARRLVNQSLGSGVCLAQKPSAPIAFPCNPL
jgi:hypothetical protein